MCDCTHVQYHTLLQMAFVVLYQWSLQSFCKTLLKFHILVTRWYLSYLLWQPLGKLTNYVTKEEWPQYKEQLTHFFQENVIEDTGNKELCLFYCLLLALWQTNCSEIYWHQQSLVKNLWRIGCNIINTLQSTNFQKNSAIQVSQSFP